MTGVDIANRVDLLCDQCQQTTRHVIYISEYSKLIAVMDGCKTCRTGVYKPKDET